MPFHCSLSLVLCLLLTACGSDPTLYLAPNGDALSLWNSEAEITGGTKIPLERLSSGLLYFEGATPTSGIELPGHGVFLITDPTAGTLTPFMKQPGECPADATWNWVGLTSPGNSDNAGTSFFGTLAWTAGALSFPTRLNLTSGADTGSTTVLLTGACEGGFLQGHSSNETTWRLAGSSALFGQRSTTANDFVLALPQAQYFSGDLVGSYTAVVVRQLGSGNVINFARFSVSTNGVNASFVGHPLSMPELASDATTTFNIGLTAFNQGTDGVATGTATIESSDFTGGVSVALNIKCIGAKTLGTLEKPVLYCVSQGYGASDDTLINGKSFHYLLRGE